MNNRQVFDFELKELSSELIRMGVAATEAVGKAMIALEKNDKDLAWTVILGDKVIDEMERSIENRCFRLLLTQQPVARDLRKINVAIKMITDIERIGDAAVDISRLSLDRGECIFPEIQKSVFEMADVARSMVDASIEAYVHEDEEAAKQTMEKDAIVDMYFIDIRNAFGQRLSRNTDDIIEIMDYLMIIKYLERVGDHAVNICEWVEFYKTGIHQKERIL
ncbi:MAG: phosphate signaling complex protein PhoU [Methanomicrobiales archaeon]|jgi:phosphate transport system protein|nr:phosphate signaling complex protein PhoU [Methanomicrobiales archaeon]